MKKQLMRELMAMGILFVFLPGTPLQALQSKFADIVITNCAPGGAYNIPEIRGLPYSLINDSGGKKSFEIFTAAARKEELKEGYEPVPDPTWVRVVPNKMSLGAGETGLSDVIISIPADPKYKVIANENGPKFY